MRLRFLKKEQRHRFLEKIHTLDDEMMAELEELRAALIPTFQKVETVSNMDDVTEPISLITVGNRSSISFSRRCFDSIYSSSSRLTTFDTPSATLRSSYSDSFVSDSLTTSLRSDSFTTSLRSDSLTCDSVVCGSVVDSNWIIEAAKGADPDWIIEAAKTVDAEWLFRRSREEDSRTFIPTSGALMTMNPTVNMFWRVEVKSEIPLILFHNRETDET